MKLKEIRKQRGKSGYAVAAMLNISASWNNRHDRRSCTIVICSFYQRDTAVLRL